MGRRSFLGLVVTGAIAAVVSGCQGSDDSADTDPRPRWARKRDQHRETAVPDGEQTWVNTAMGFLLVGDGNLLYTKMVQGPSPAPSVNDARVVKAVDGTLFVVLPASYLADDTRRTSTLPPAGEAVPVETLIYWDSDTHETKTARRLPDQPSVALPRVLLGYTIKSVERVRGMVYYLGPESIRVQDKGLYILKNAPIARESSLKLYIPVVWDGSNFVIYSGLEGYHLLSASEDIIPAKRRSGNPPQ